MAGERELADLGTGRAEGSLPSSKVGAPALGRSLGRGLVLGIASWYSQLAGIKVKVDCAFLGRLRDRGSYYSCFTSERFKCIFCPGSHQCK